MMPPSIRRVPPQTPDDVPEYSEPDVGRYVATFMLGHAGGIVNFRVVLPWRDGNPTIAELEAEAREALRNRLTEIIAEI